MTRVYLFDFLPFNDFHGFRIETFNPLAYFKSSDRWSLPMLLFWGLNGFIKARAVMKMGAVAVDRLYRERDPAYMRMVGDFIDRFREFDLIILSTYNFIHPEVLVRELRKPTKILGFVDDPVSTYQAGIPFLWAFDGAFFISPGYIHDLPFDQAIRRWTDKPVTWWPLAPYGIDRAPRADESFFRKRDVDVVYVGKDYPSKVDRLVQLKRHFGSRLRVHGRWTFKGYIGFLRGLLGRPIYPYRVTSLTQAERTALYWRTKIGFNMHFSGSGSECGNARTYEVPAHGLMMVCDKGAAGSHARIFEPGREAVYYDTIDEAIEAIEYYLARDDERIAIAKAGFERFWRDYEWEANLLRFLRWAEGVHAARLAKEGRTNRDGLG